MHDHRMITPVVDKSHKGLVEFVSDADREHLVACRLILKLSKRSLDNPY